MLVFVGYVGLKVDKDIGFVECFCIEFFFIVEEYVGIIDSIDIVCIGLESLGYFDDCGL